MSFSPIIRTFWLIQNWMDYYNFSKGILTISNATGDHQQDNSSVQSHVYHVWKKCKTTGVINGQEYYLIFPSCTTTIFLKTIDFTKTSGRYGKRAKRQSLFYRKWSGLWFSDIFLSTRHKVTEIGMQENSYKAGKKIDLKSFAVKAKITLY